MRMQKGANQGSIYRVAERRSAVHFPRNSLEKKKTKTANTASSYTRPLSSCRDQREVISEGKS